MGAYVAKTAKAANIEIKVVGFSYYKKGEGLEKKTDDFAKEVEKLTQKT